MRVFVSLVFIGLLAVFVSAGNATAGGAFLYEFGTPDVGLASAGFAARAEDASTLFKNPAGMSRLEKNHQWQLGAPLLYADEGFRGTNTPWKGNDGGNPIGLFPGGGGLFYVHSFTKDLKAGLGFFSYFGQAVKFEEEWLGRYFSMYSTVMGLTIMPAVSYRINDQFSIGAGLNGMYGILSQKANINNTPLGQDGQMKVSDQTWAFGADVGILWEPEKGTRFGVTYLSPVSLDFKDTPELVNASPAVASLGSLSLDLGVTVPQTVMVSAYHRLNRQWAFMGNLGWQQWSRFGMRDFMVVSDSSGKPTSLTADRKYRDTWHVAAGTEYSLSPQWSFTGGFAYDSSAVADGDRTLDFIVGDTYRFGTGALWQLNPQVRLGFAYELAWMGNLPVDQSRGPLSGRVAGSYNDSAIHFLALNLSWSP